MNIKNCRLSEVDCLIESLEAFNAFYENYLQIIERFLDPNLCRHIKLCVAYKTTYQESYDRDSVLEASNLSSNALTRFTNKVIESGEKNPIEDFLKDWLS